jgi:2-oxoisovalerate dehydrogenase E2 component (dihydrolipoyl transacylase)
MAERVFAMPDLGEGLEEGEIVSWLVTEGDTVTLNQPLVEVETAKAVVEIPSPVAGVVAALHAAAGGTVAVGGALVTFSVEGGDVDGSGEGDGGGESFAGGAARSHGETSTGGQASTGSGRGAEPPAALSPPPAAGTVSTPAVRRLARDLGVRIESVAGTGPGGRVTSEDVRRAAGGTAPASSDEASGDEVVAVTRRRGAIAERLMEVAGVPQVTTFRTVDCGALEEFREELGLSPLPIVLAALSRVVADHPLLNASWAGDSILLHRTVNVGVAVDAEQGLVVPVVGDVGALGLAAIASEVERLAAGARGGGLEAGDVGGATIAVSNTGSYGSEAGTPLLNPGNAVTVAIGVIGPRALVVDGEVVARPACTLSLTFDHRVLDGATAGRALTDLVALLQDRERLRDLKR